jgi:asparagine synthase (glutamine-hydrolysing)
MCGIFAFLSKRKLAIDSSYLSTRGPNSSTTITIPSGVFSFYRLSINDTTMNGNQPMVSGNILMMCNGEIYNHLELEKEFDLRCNSRSDCEVIIRLYEKIGFEEMVKKLYGVFAIILVDGDTTYLARDRIGVRPLYYGWNEGELMIASVPNVLVKYCTGVTHFPPGLTAVCKNNVITPLTRHVLCIREPTLSEPLVTLRDTLIDAVKIRLMSDRPMGCLLSGGLDSSIITAILVKFLGGENVRTYSIGMEGSTDLYYARKVAEALRTKHTEILFTPEEGFAVIPKVIETLASYDITTIRASVGMYLVSKYISENTDDKVIFSGEGSDELLEGYLYFHNAPTSEEGRDEALRLVQNLHMYDVLRADRCISVNGLEPRVPFLDKKFVDATLALSAEDKSPRNGFEKYVLRKAFEGYLPEEILWRRKEGFSDGVSSVKKSWYHYIQEMVEPLIEGLPKGFPSKEAMYYKTVFNNIFPSYNLDIKYWMPKWTNSTDPSGRLIKAYDLSATGSNLCISDTKLL